MRLTKYDREAFVLACMADVPTIDYNEQAVALVRADIVATMHPMVRAVYDNKGQRQQLDSTYVSLGGYFNSRAFYGAVGYRIGETLKAQLSQLAEAAKVQHERDAALEDKLTATIACCTTLKTALERLPEFVAYLPTERDGTGVVNLPAVANLVTDLMAAGWPKAA